MKRLLIALVLAVVALPSAPLADDAQANKTSRVCASTTMRSSSGTERTELQRGDRVIVLKRDRKRKRSYVIAADAQGWIPSNALCKRR